MIQIAQSNQEETQPLMSAEDLYKAGKMPDMMQHWYTIRRQYPQDFLLAYRMGDFYEFFYDDAVNVSRILGLTLTIRGSGPIRHPLAGIPHKATQHFKTLVKSGQTVIIVEQLEDPKKATGKIVKRGVVRILSPGTVVDDNLLESSTANYICGIFRDKKNFGASFLDMSSGDFFTSEFYGKNATRALWASVSRFSPVEAVLPSDLLADFTFMSEMRENVPIIVKEHPQYHFLYQNAYQTLLAQFDVENLHGFDFEGKNLGISAAGGLISFIKETQKGDSLDNIRRISFIYDDRFMFLDTASQRNLELLQNQADGGTYGTLFDCLHHTKTPMGTRLLKNWIVQPLIEKPAIDRRLDLVGVFLNHYDLSLELRNMLSQMGDLSRLISRINYSSTVNARNLLHLKNGLEIVNEIKNLFQTVEIPIIQEKIAQLENFSSIIALIGEAIHENPPITITEGGIIKDGYNAQIDEYRDILHNGKNWILKFEEQEKRRLGAGAGIKIAYNRVLGYYIQITNNAMKGLNIPDDYIQRQTLTGAVRYETPRLKEMETKILSAEENVMDLEYQLFQGIREKVQEFTLPIQKNADIIAELDVLSCFADVAQNYNYCRPVVGNDTRIVIKQGRHPVVEQINTKEPFVPNDSLMDNTTEQILIITGPNWSGKSTYLRQTALIVLLAQIGSYVPAQSAEIGIVDRIFTRIGASDDLTRGQSTFMLEMTETAQILNYATEKSLIIIDELGRGTGTADGQAIAQSVLEFLHDMGIKTLFSTHFHQLITLSLPRIHNYHFKILEKSDTRRLVFLRQLTNGGTDKSYGIHVAMMAGLPNRVTERAFDLMEHIISTQNGGALLQPIPMNGMTTPTISQSEKPRKNVVTNYEARDEVSSVHSEAHSQAPKPKRRGFVQTSLFPVQRYDDSELIILLRSLDLERMTPLQAFEALVQLKKKITP